MNRLHIRAQIHKADKEFTGPEFVNAQGACFYVLCKLFHGIFPVLVGVKRQTLLRRNAEDLISK